MDTSIQRAHILLIDEDDQRRPELLGWLRQRQYTVTYSASKREGICKLRSSLGDTELVILDMTENDKKGLGDPWPWDR